ncbi:MAG: InlB B-repeat-containing protein [Clostridia bacterium]|nr:InlB B-repeat-containing protein [Clostridia bacterium]
MKKCVKRLFSILLMCAVMLSTCGIGMAYASDETIVVGADPVTVRAGEHFEVPIQMSGGQGLMGFSVSFTYDESVMKPISVSPANGIGGGWENSIDTAKDNSFFVVWYGTENMTVQGTVFTITFEAKTYAMGDYSIQVDYDQASTFNEAWQDVALQTSTINVHIENDHPTPKFMISDTSITAGEIYSCDVYVQNNTGFGVTSFTLTFDDTVLIPKEIHAGIGSVLYSNMTGTPGSVQVILDQVSAESGDGILFTIQFQTSISQSGCFPISISCNDNYYCKSGSVTLTKETPTGNPVVDIQQDVVVENDTVSIPVHITNNIGIMGLRLRLTMDSTKFVVESCDRGSMLSNGVLDYRFDETTGVVDIIWCNSEATYTEGVCCVLNIQIIDQSADTLELKIDYEPEDTFDETLTNVALTCYDAEISLRTTRTIYYNANGGNCTTETSVVAYNGTYGELPVASKLGYTFNGWFTAAEGGNLVTEDTVVEVTGDQTLYAQWTANTFSVSFDANGGSCEDEEKMVTFDAPYGVLPPATKIGYVFIGWFTEPNGGILITNDSVVSITEAQTLYAQFEAKMLIVTLDSNTGSCDTENIFAFYDGLYGTLPVAEKEGYAFLGWFTDEEDGEQITDASLVTNTDNHTLYAHWEEVAQRISGDASGDGLIDLTDVVLLRRFLTGGWDVTVNASNADVNADGVLDLKDVVILRRYLAGGWGVVLL